MPPARSRRRSRRRLRTALAVVTAAVVVASLAGCGGSDDPAAGPGDASGATSASSTPDAPDDGDGAAVGGGKRGDRATGDDPLRYVALGDSYAAAPGIPTTSGEDGCFRSDHNYAHLLAAAEPGVELSDQTCSGADTAAVLRDQLPAVDASTDLVTLTIGGNDDDLFAQLVGSCLSGAGTDPTGSPCTDQVGRRVEQQLARVGDRVGDVLDAVTAAAPDATVVAVGYPGLLPARGACPDRLPLATGDYPLLHRVNQALSDALRDEADERGLEFLDVAAATRGHDICSDDPWVNGLDVAADGTIPLHPLLPAEEAIARRLRSSVARMQ